MNTETKPRIVYPTVSILDPRFVWSPRADVQATWRRFGWQPAPINQLPPVGERRPFAN